MMSPKLRTALQRAITEEVDRVGVQPYVDAGGPVPAVSAMVRGLRLLGRDHYATELEANRREAEQMFAAVLGFM